MHEGPAWHTSVHSSGNFIGKSSCCHTGLRGVGFGALLSFPDAGTAEREPLSSRFCKAFCFGNCAGAGGRRAFQSCTRLRDAHISRN